MGILDIFKKKTQKRVLTMHKVQLKNICKNKDDLYVGKICNIYGTLNKNDEETYYLETYEGKKVGNFKVNDFNYCDKYNYAAIYSISEKEISACIICDNVYPMSLKIELAVTLKNGIVLKINKDGSLLDSNSNNIVGKIIDNRLSTLNLENIALSQIDNNKLLTLIYK